MLTMVLIVVYSTQFIQFMVRNLVFASQPLFFFFFLVKGEEKKNTSGDFSNAGEASLEVRVLFANNS